MGIIFRLVGIGLLLVGVLATAGALWFGRPIEIVAGCALWGLSGLALLDAATMCDEERRMRKAMEEHERKLSAIARTLQSR